MLSARDVVYYLFHIQELQAIIQWKTHKPVHERDESNESHDVKECWRFLALTSRSFVAVIQQVHPELLMPICVFYLILRGLDTIEDDMTISIEEKEPLLRQFYTFVDDENWNFHGSGPDEKDRELLVEFDCVTREFNRINEEEYKAIIRDITKRMGNGMADYAKNAESTAVKTIADYELYCHYVAGLVGEGLTRLFVKAKLASPTLLEKPELSESMGQFLQHTNIIRDIREDYDDNRSFWPKEVWSKYVDKFSYLFLLDLQAREKALQCSSEMVLMALNRADECLSYMAGIQEQSIFNFVAIPQSMAIATLELCFQNPAIFDRNVKMTKVTACQLMIESTQDLQRVCGVFRRYAKRIQSKNKPSDPNFNNINVACANIERFIETNFPRQQEAEPAKNLVYLAVLIFAALGIITTVVVRSGFPV